MIIWLASYPRSGSTYLRILLKHFYRINTYSLYQDQNITERSPIGEIVGHVPRPGPISRMAEASDVCIVRTHEMPADDFPAIYLVRDGRDALVSYAHYILSFVREKKKEFTPGAFKSTLRNLIALNDSFGGWGSHVTAWTRRSGPTAVLKFEDLISHPSPQQLIQVALAGLDYDPTKSSSQQPGNPPTFDELHQMAPLFFRSGNLGDWKTTMPADFQELFWQIHGEAMIDMEYLEGRKETSESSADRQAKLVQALNKTIDEKEQIILAQAKELKRQALTLERVRVSIGDWLSNSPFNRFAAYRVGLNILYFIHALLVPRITLLNQHKPRPLQIPDRYYREREPSPEMAPHISIVTPSYNQGAFIEQTINSVLAQKYSRLEYIIRDAASTDQTLEILKKYSQDLAEVVSDRDSGQADAINLGFAASTGEIMAFLNADDILLPGALNYVGSYFREHLEVDVVYSHRIIIDENDKEIGRWVLPPHTPKMLQWADYVPQETLFWRRRIWDKVGGWVDDSFKFALDWDLLLRFEAAGANIIRLPRFLAAFRVHPGQKTAFDMNDTGLVEMERLRTRIHGRAVAEREVMKNIRPYWWKSHIYQKLYRLGLLRH